MSFSGFIISYKIFCICEKNIILICEVDNDGNYYKKILKCTEHSGRGGTSVSVVCNTTNCVYNVRYTVL